VDYNLASKTRSKVGPGASADPSRPIDSDAPEALNAAWSTGVTPDSVILPPVTWKTNTVSYRSVLPPLVTVAPRFLTGERPLGHQIERCVVLHDAMNRPCRGVPGGDGCPAVLLSLD
jgi:hypothetical protein